MTFRKYFLNFFCIVPEYVQHPPTPVGKYFSSNQIFQTSSLIFDLTHCWEPVMLQLNLGKGAPIDWHWSLSDDAKLERQFFYAQIKLLNYIHWSGSSTLCLKRKINLQHLCGEWRHCTDSNPTTMTGRNEGCAILVYFVLSQQCTFIPP